jgi:hypothetical protein
LKMTLTNLIEIANIVATIAAVLAAPVVALWIGSKLQRRSEARKSKLALLATLVATRHDPISLDAIRALNLIDVTFVDDLKVREAWSKYYSVLVDSGSLNDITGTIPLQRESRRALLLEMIKSVNWEGKISTADIIRAYAPVAFNEQTQIDFMERRLKLSNLKQQLADRNISDPAVEALIGRGPPGVLPVGTSRKDGAATSS